MKEDKKNHEQHNFVNSNKKIYHFNFLINVLRTLVKICLS